jgi:hypothetical protein
MQNIDSLPCPDSDSLPKRRLKEILALGCASLLLAIVGAVFWYQDGRYSLPTPRPSALVAVDMGQRVVLPVSLDPAAKRRPTAVAPFL